MSLRSMIERMCVDVGSSGYSTALIKKDRAAVDMQRLNREITRIVVFALVLERACAYLEEHSECHPLVAFVHATKDPEIFRNGVAPLSDEEFFKVLDSWRVLCGVTPFVPLGGRMRESIEHVLKL